VILFILILKWIKKGVATAIFTFSVWLNIVILIVPIIGGFVALDLMNFSKELTNNPKYIILQENKNFVFGINFEGQDIKNYTLLTTEQLNSIRKEINKNKVKDKIVFVVNEEVFRSIENIPIKEAGTTISKITIIRILKSDYPIDVLVDNLPKELTQGVSRTVIEDKLSEQFGSLREIKVMAALLLVEAALEKQGPKYFIDELKNGNIAVYPERFSLKLLIKLLPSDLVSSFLPQMPNLEKQIN